MAQHRYHYYMIYKPFGVLSQFTDPVGGKRTLGELYDFPPRVYPVGRLDEDSEGLLILTDDPRANSRLLGQGVEKEYLVQVEGEPDDGALAPLRGGIEIRIKKKRFTTLPAAVSLIHREPDLPDRDPPIRFRKSVPDAWISLVLREGKNRQVRKMTAKVGFPTLRLVRVRMGKLQIGTLEVGEVKDLSQDWDWNWFQD